MPINSHLTADNFNPDCFTSPDELGEWTVFFGTSMFPEAAKLYGYCRCKQEAMRARLSGDIANATHLESMCDDIYASLPKNSAWRW